MTEQQIPITTTTTTAAPSPSPSPSPIPASLPVPHHPLASPEVEKALSEIKDAKDKEPLLVFFDVDGCFTLLFFERYLETWKKAYPRIPEVELIKKLTALKEEMLARIKEITQGATVVLLSGSNRQSFVVEIEKMLRGISIGRSFLLLGEFSKESGWIYHQGLYPDLTRKQPSGTTMKAANRRIDEYDPKKVGCNLDAFPVEQIVQAKDLEEFKVEQFIDNKGPVFEALLERLEEEGTLRRLSEIHGGKKVKAIFLEDTPLIIKNTQDYLSRVGLPTGLSEFKTYQVSFADKGDVLNDKLTFEPKGTVTKPKFSPTTMAAAHHVRERYLSQPFEAQSGVKGWHDTYGSSADAPYIKDGITVHRPANNSVHAERCRKLLRVSAEFLAERAKDAKLKQFCAELLGDAETLEWAEIAMLFSQTGRTCGVGFTENKEVYKAGRSKAAENFNTYYLEKDPKTNLSADFYSEPLRELGNLEYKPADGKLTKRYLQILFTFAQTLDLFRIADPRAVHNQLVKITEKVGGIESYNYNALKRLERYAVDLLVATGDRLANDFKSESKTIKARNYYQDPFQQLSQDVEACIRTVASVPLPQYSSLDEQPGKWDNEAFIWSISGGIPKYNTDGSQQPASVQSSSSSMASTASSSGSDQKKSGGQKFFDPKPGTLASSLPVSAPELPPEVIKILKELKLSPVGQAGVEAQSSLLPQADAEKCAQQLSAALIELNCIVYAMPSGISGQANVRIQAEDAAKIDYLCEQSGTGIKSVMSISSGW